MTKEDTSNNAKRTAPDEPKDLRQANDNIRQAEGDEPSPSADTRKAGNKPAFDRDR